MTRAEASPRTSLTVTEACAAVLAELRPLDPEVVRLEAALGRVLARDVVSPLALPPWDNASMDGYAVHAADVRGARTDAPIALPVVETVAAGGAPTTSLPPGAAIRIMTGAPVPEGADSVIRIEDTDRGIEQVLINDARDAGRNVRPRGEDIGAGAVALEAGTVIGPAQLGVLASVGATRVTVRRRPRVAVLATGDEIVPPDVTPKPGQARNVNQYALRALITAAGCEPVDFGVLPDREPVIRAAMRKALAKADAVLISGGSSVGTKDLTPAVVAAMPRARILVHGIRIKPGKPTLVARALDKPIIGLPGNPTSALVIFHV